MDYITYTHGTHGGSIPEGQGNGADLMLEKGVPVAVGAPEQDGRGRITDTQWVTEERAKDLVEAGKCSLCDQNGCLVTATIVEGATPNKPAISATPANKALPPAPAPDAATPASESKGGDTAGANAGDSNPAA